MYDEDQSVSVRAIIHPPVFFIAGFAVLLFLDWAWPWRITRGEWYQTAAIVCLGSGLLLIGAAFYQLRKAGEHIPSWHPTIALRAHGVYRYTRNPIYVGLSATFLGCGIALNIAWVIPVLAIVLLALQETVIRQEEAYLRRKYGEEYDEYLKHVRRWF